MRYPARRQTDKFEKAPRRQISRLAFLLAGLLIAVTAISLTFVGFIASEEADQQALASEKRLFKNAMDDRLARLAREQLSLARWDTTVSNVVYEFDIAFIRDEFLGSLWHDFRHDRTLLVDGSDKILAETFQDYTHFTGREMRATDQVYTLVNKARARFMQNRVRIPGGFSQRAVHGVETSEISELAFMILDGRPAMVGAMAVVPDDETVVLPDGPPVILVSAKFLTAEVVSDLNAQLSFKSLRFEVGAPAFGPMAYVRVRTPGDEILGAFTWTSERPGSQIWATVVPVILVLGFLLACLAFSIAWRIGKLTSSLQLSEQQNRFLALHDNLSGLANRLQINQALTEAIDGLPAKSFALMHCDLDKFKDINDTHGHAAGDMVIKIVAARLKTIIGDAGLVGRTGGDEFVVLIKSYTDHSRLAILSAQIIDSITSPMELGDSLLGEVGISIGIAVAPKDGRKSETIMAQADAALYRAKELGRGQAMFASDLLRHPVPAGTRSNAA